MPDVTDLPTLELVASQERTHEDVSEALSPPFPAGHQKTSVPRAARQRERDCSQNRDRESDSGVVQSASSVPAVERSPIQSSTGFLRP